MTLNYADDLIARALLIACSAKESSQADADAMLDLLLDRYPDLAQKLLHNFKGLQPAPHLRVMT